MTATTTTIRTAFTAALNDHAAFSASVTDAMATLETDVAAAVQKVLAIVGARDAVVRDLIAQAIGVVPTRDADATGAAPDVYVSAVSGMSGATLVVGVAALG